MKVVVKPSGRQIAPFQDAVSEIQVLGRSLSTLMEEEFERAGIEFAYPTQQLFLTKTPES